MQPEWLGEDSLASDQDLRKLQLRWLRDDLWMRRIVFALWVASLLSLMISLGLHRMQLAAVSGTGFGILTTPVAYFFRVRRKTL